MNIVSLILAIAAAVIFVLAFRGQPWATIGLGLFLLTVAWVVQLLWASAKQISL